jgi:hypothetical protein
VPADAEHLGGAAHGVVRLGRAVQREPPARGPLVAHARQRPLARGGQRGQVRERAAGRHQPVGVGAEADEVTDPADGLALQRRRGAGTQRDVDVVGGHQRVPEHADLQPGAADPREEAGAGLRQRRVEHPGGVVERDGGVERLLRQRLAQQCEIALGGLGVLGTRAVERSPGVEDQPRRVFEHRLAVAQRQRTAIAHQPCTRSGAV